MTEKRHELEIKRDILLNILKSRGIKQTPLMYKANLQYKTLSPRIKDYILKGWIKRKSNLIVITNEGIDYLLNLHCMIQKFA